MQHNKASKAQVDYSRGMKESHCGRAFPDDKGYCQHFIGPYGSSELGTCSKVEGPINRLYWCRLFARAKR